MDKLLSKFKHAPSQSGIEQVRKCWKDEKKWQSRFKIAKDKGFFDAYLFYSQRKIKESPPPGRILEYAALKSQNEVLKTSLTFEKEKQKKLGTEVDNLMIEIPNWKTDYMELKNAIDFS